MQEDRQIIHMDQDAFFVAVETRKNRDLEGKPVIIGSPSDRGVVASCSYTARKYGIHAAMPSRMAKQLCPHAIFIRGNMDEYTRASQEVTTFLTEKVPLFEKASIDEHYIDLTGMERYFGCMKFAHELRASIMKETHLPISLGLSVNKTISKMATNKCKPHGEREVKQTNIRSFLDPLSIKKIPGLGSSTYLKLSEMGVRHIHKLIRIPPEMMMKMMGQAGLTLWQKANGIDPSPIVPYREQQSIGTQSTFSADSMDVVAIKALLAGMVTNIAYELRQKRKLTACITVTIRYTNFETVTKQAKIPYTSLDHLLIAKAKELFDQVYNRRMLLRLVGVKLSHLVGGHEQISLYETSEKRYNLYQVMDNMRNRYGDKAVQLASSLALDW